VQCENLPTGASSNPAPDSNLSSLNPISPIPNDGTTASVDSSCNAILQTGLACNAPKTARQKFCKKCTTRIRVRALRAKNAPLRELKAKVDNGFKSERRSPVTGCTTGSTLLRDVGKNTDYLRAKEIEQKCTDARKLLRAEFKKQRDTLKQQIAALTPALKKAIAESDAAIRRN
jgi:hypothetical protein